MSNTKVLPLINPDCAHCKKPYKDCQCLENADLAFEKKFGRSAAASKQIRFPVKPPQTSSAPKPLTWATMSGLQKFLMGLGYVFTAIIALGCGISIAAAFITLSIMTAGAASYFIAAMLFVAGTVVNWLIYKNSVPEVLVDMLGKETWFQGLFEVPGGCDLLTVEEKPTKAYAIKLHSKAGYVRYKGKGGENALYYVNKITGELKKLTKQATLTAFDKAMGIDDTTDKDAFKNKLRTLNYKEQQKVSELTGHQLLSTKKKVLMVVGFFLALAAGIMQGVLTYGSTFTLSTAFAFLAGISSAFPPIAAVLATVTVVSLTAVLLKNIANWVKTHNVLQEGKIFFGGLFDFSTPRCELHVSTVAPEAGKLDELGIRSSAAYIRVHNELYYVDKDNNSFTKLNLKVLPWQFDQQMGIRDGKQSQRKLNFQEVEQIAGLAGQEIKSRGRIIAERVLTAILTLLALPLAALGVYMTMNACANGTKAFLLKSIPSASAMVVDICAKVLGLGLAFLGRIPFTMRNTIRTISHFFSTKLDKTTVDPQQKKAAVAKDKNFLAWMWDAIKTTTLYLFCFINAIGNGLISMVGAGRTVGPILGGVSGGAGTLNSLTAGVASGLLGGSTAKVSAAATHTRKHATVDDFGLVMATKPAVQQKDLPKLQRAKSTMFAFDPSNPNAGSKLPPSPKPPSLVRSRSTIDLKPLSF